MFREITISKKSEGGPKRRWYQSDYFDLYIFYLRHSERMDKHADREFVGMQLCYDIRRNQRTLEWKKEEGFSHHAVQKGGDTMSDHGSSAALLQKGGTFDSQKVIDLFMRDSGSLPGQIKIFVLKQLTEYARLNPPLPPTAEELAAAAAAARVAEQIAAQVEAEAQALQAEQDAAQQTTRAPADAVVSRPVPKSQAASLPSSSKRTEPAPVPVVASHPATKSPSPQPNAAADVEPFSLDGLLKS